MSKEKKQQPTNNSEKDWEELQGSFTGYVPPVIEVYLFDEGLYRQAHDKLPKSAN